MEVSSHSIAARRVSSTFFSNVAFTNLTQDHLDFHGDMETYFQEKAKIFAPEFAGQGFVNVDDSYGKRLAEMAPIPIQTISRSSTLASWHYSSYQISGNGYDVAIRGLGGILIEGHLPLVGEHNLDNALMAIALAVESGIDPVAIAMDMHKLNGPAGRLEKVDIGQKYLALVDYAHTPDAVERVLSAVRQITSGRVIAILGCGGDRDSSKRSLMGKALVNGSDFAVLTSDNPRSENPIAILTQMSADIELGDNVVQEEDRRGAIAVAVAEATPGDTVIILGKGHEVGQEINGIKYPFDDRIELAKAIEKLS
jgi:UDP-N-acetylmuramoyl-L-alanyl-D-glutamate--2,6-diaminopimelate ligase